MPLLGGSYLDTVLRMTRKKDLLLDEALCLPKEDRAEIAVKLIESLDGNPDDDVDTTWAQEIERRCAAVDAGEAVTSDWEEVRSRIEREIFRR